MGSVVDRHAAPERGKLAHEKYTKEAMVAWNGPKSHEARNFLSQALDAHFKGKRWNFYPEGYMPESKQYYLKSNVSEVVDRHKKASSKFPFYA
eukprot:7657833-Pyramimonas_sp.AAC.1